MLTRPASISLRFLLDPTDPTIVRSISDLLAEMKRFEGTTFGEMIDDLEERNRIEKSEQRRMLRLELAHHLAEGSEAELPHGILPAEARRTLFRCVWDRGLGFILPTNDLFQPDADVFYSEAAKILNIDSASLRDSLYMDIPEAHRVVFPEHVERTPPAQIVGALNVRRLKQKLRRALSIKLAIARSTTGDSPYAAILWSLKRNRLMYDVSADARFLHLRIRGPGALIEKSTVYGNRLASFTVDVLHHTHQGFAWSLEAEILARGRSSGSGDSLEMLRLGPGMQKFFPGVHGEGGAVDFKSSDEAAFQRYFQRLESDWVLHYEATIIPMTKQDGTTLGFMIPDFVAVRTRDGGKALIEIMGFWREEYLRRKIEKSGLVEGVQMFLVVNKGLAADRSGLDQLSGRPNIHILFYSGRNELKAAAAEIAALLA